MKPRFAAACVAAIGMLWLAASPALATKQVYCLPTHIRHAATKDAIRLNLEVASTPEKRSLGLMYRERIAPCDGMAFFFPPARHEVPSAFAVQKFWMKNTRIPLDILFIDAQNRITHIASGVPQSLESIGPDIPSATVIEIDAGRAAKEGIAVGDTVLYELATFPHLLAR